MKIYKLTSRCNINDFEGGCSDFEVEVEEFDTIEEAQREAEYDHLDYLPVTEASGALVCYEYNYVWWLGTKKQIQYSFDSSQFYNLDADESEIDEHIAELESAIEDMED